MKARAAPDLCASTKGIIAEDESGKIAAVIMDSWSKSSCQIHICIEKMSVLRHGLLEEVARYVFDTAGRSIIIGVTPSNNEKALKFNEHIGLKEIFRIKDGYDMGIDYVITRMDRDSCRWYQHKEAA